MMDDLISLAQLMRGKNPEQMAMNMINNNPKIANDPMLSNAVSMAQEGDINGLTNLASELFKQNGLNFPTIYSNFMNMMR